MSFMPETSTTAEVRQTEVKQEFGRVEECTSYIEKIVSELEENLSRSILAQRPGAKEAAGSPIQPEPVRVPMAQTLHEHGDRLERIRERLSSIISRIEA